ncbi:MAG: GspH/FimT family protein [Burkholderiales bacterium]|jgi:type IV fimbrial biogenesis protein FimT|nr:GspH/FimT family protein [Burkholderiales bacterium]
MHKNTLRHALGFTVVEAAIATAVAATLTASAVPHFKASLDRQALTSTANELQLSIELGRSEALSRGQRVVLAPQRPNDWASGWLLYRDDNDNGVREDAEPIVRVFNAPPQGLAVRSWGGPANNVLSFTDDGFLRRPGGNGLAMGGISFSVGDQVRTVCFSATRTRVTTATSCGS